MSYSHLSDDELVRSLNHKRMLSPLVEELCLRLEKHQKHPPFHNSAIGERIHTAEEISCAVCGAKLADQLEEAGYVRSI